MPQREEPKPFPQFEGRHITRVHRPPRSESPNPDVVPILRKLNTAAYRFGVQIEDEFRSEDSRHCGILTQQQIYDAISRFADLNSSESKVFFQNYSDGYYKDILDDLNHPECAPVRETKRNISAITEPLERLKGSLSERSISMFDILGSKYVPIPRAISLLSRYTPDAEVIVRTFTDSRRPELCDVSDLQMAYDSVSPKRTFSTSTFNQSWVQSDLQGIKMSAQARRKRVESLFDGAPNYVPFDEFSRRLQVLNSNIDSRSLARIRSCFECERGIDWQKFCEAVYNSGAL